jgi:ribonuclease HI
MSEPKIKVYTDGAARGNPGPAGWGVVFISPEKIVEFGGRTDHATNNQMELTAAIEALKYLEKNNMVHSVEIFADSKYVILGITEWISNWMCNGWRNAAKKPVLNRELWEEFYELNQKINPTWSYVRGHQDDVWNNRADEIATTFADNLPINLRS